VSWLLSRTLAKTPKVIKGCCIIVAGFTELGSSPGRSGRDRNAGCPAPLAQIPACATNALGSCLGFWRQSVEPGNRVQEQSKARTAATARRTAPKSFGDVGYGAEAHATNIV